MTTEERIVALLKEVSGSATIPDRYDSLFESDYLDSFGFTDMIGALEGEFGITVPDSDLSPRQFDSVASIECYIARLVPPTGR